MTKVQIDQLHGIFLDAYEKALPLSMSMNFTIGSSARQLADAHAKALLAVLDEIDKTVHLSGK